MRGLNRVTLIGNCGKEPEYKQLEDGTPVAKIALATTEMFRLKNGEITLYVRTFGNTNVSSH